VRWESGLPMRLARRDSSPLTADRTRYVLSMSRLPVSLVAATSKPGKAEAGDESALRAQIADQVARSTTLQCVNKAPIHADHAEWVQSGFESRLMISIPHDDGHAIELADGAVSFVSEIGDFIIRTSFLLSRMRYKDNLEL
jgi:hypothetical protein